ncbi:MAG: diguanylate cyclase [Endozoicomonas sp.]
MLAVMLLLSLPLASFAKTALAVPEKSLGLSSYLVKTTPPEELFQSTSDVQGKELWYRLNLKLNSDLNDGWLLVFRRVPFSRLDVFLPTGAGFRLYALGQQHNVTTKDPRILELNLKAGKNQTIYIRASTTQPNRLAPELWPEALYTLNEYKSRGIAASFQSLLVLFLVVTGIITIITRNHGYLVLTGHLLATNMLLLMWQGDIFRYISWAGDPGHWVLSMSAVVIISALACYKNLALLPLYTPVTDRVLVWMNFLAAGLIFSHGLLNSSSSVLIDAGFSLLLLSALLLTGTLLFCLLQGVTAVRLALPLLLVITICLAITWTTAPWPRAVPTGAETILFSVHGLFLTGLYWINRQQKHRQAMAINVVSSHNDRRRIFDSALRKHLQTASESLTDETIRDRVLTTMDAVLPGMPALIVQQSNSQWSITSHYPKAAQLFESQIPVLEDSLQDIIAAGTEDRIHLQNQRGIHYWAFLLNRDSDQHTLLILAPGRSHRQTGKWQQACDICSHARALYQASEQTRFWQLQASLDPLTGALNRRAFTREAEPVVSQVNEEPASQCCLMFLDIDDFKQINDRFGHSAGDRVLADIAKRCREDLRQQDLLARYGGEEFVILLPETSAWQATQIAERIRRTVALYDGGPVPITISIGVAASGNHNNSLDKLLNEADQALYDAKREGKNRVARAPSCQDFRLLSH